MKTNLPPLSSWSDAEETLLKKLNIRSKLQEQSVAYFLSMTEEEIIASNLPVELLDGLKKGAVAEI